jgi:hypothetical protein
VKNNRDLKNIIFNIVDKEHKKFIYNDVAFLLILVIINGALFRYETLNNL